MNPDFETAFATFLTKAQTAADADYSRSSCNPFHGPKLSAMHGKRYIRIVSEIARIARRMGLRRSNEWRRAQMRWLENAGQGRARQHLRRR